MNNCLILLTNYYPFHKGEEYLENEINYLAEKYTKIIIISTMADIKMVQTRNVPKNVEIIKSDISHSVLGKIKMFVVSFKNARKKITSEPLLRKDGGKSIFKRIFTLYFESRAQFIYTKIEPELTRIDFNDYKVKTIYSYWFYITARIGNEINTKFFNKEKVYFMSRAHGYDINEHVNPLNFLPQREYLLQNIDNLYTVSKDGETFLKRKYPNFSCKVETRRLGTISSKNKAFTGNENLVLISCSTVRKLKRIDLIIESLELLKDEEIKFKWTHIGSGPELEEVKKLAAKKLNKDSYEFTGSIKNSEVLEWYNNNIPTIFINTSESEGVPISIMEAMSMGVPVIATDVGGTKEIVEHGETGILIHKESTKIDIKEAILEIYNYDSLKFNELSEKSLESWGKKSNADKLFKEFTDEISNSSSYYTNIDNVNTE